MAPSPDRRRTRLALLVAAATLFAGAGFVAVATSAAAAAAGCRVDYTVNQWSTGFTADVHITNLGPAINGWTLEFDYAGNQQITQSWNSSYGQSGRHVALRDAGYNAAVATNAVVTASVVVLALDFLLTKLLITLLY